MKMKQLKTVTVLVAALALTTSTAAAAEPGAAALPQTETAVLAAQSVKTPLGSVKDSKFILTLEDAVTMGDRVGIVYSVEGVTDAAKAEVMGQEFYGEALVKLPQGADYGGMSLGEMRNLNTTAKRYFYGIIDEIVNPQGLTLSFGLNAMTGDVSYVRTPADEEGLVFSLTRGVAAGRDELYIPILADTTRPERTLTLPAASGKNTTVVISPLDIAIEKAPFTGHGSVMFNTDMFFRLQDDSLKTMSELYKIDSFQANNTYADGTPKQSYTGIANHVIDLTQIKSIIVGNQEYSFNDPTQVKEVQIPENMRPVSLKTFRDNTFSSHYVAAKEAIEKLGGQFTVDASGKAAIIQYRGVTVEIKEGEAAFVRNGVTMSPYALGPAKITDGTWMIDTYLFRTALNVDSDSAGGDDWYLIP